MPARRSTSKAYDFALAGSPHRFGDYEAGEKIDHVDGITVEEAEHQTATRLYQNTARIHFDQFSAAQGRFGRRLIYGGHVISLARAHLVQRARPTPSISPRSTAGATSRRCSRARRCSPGRRCWRKRAAGAQRRRRAAAAHRRDEGPALRGFPVQGRRRNDPGRSARSRLLGADPADSSATGPAASPRRAGGDHRNKFQSEAVFNPSLAVYWLRSPA